MSRPPNPEETTFEAGDHSAQSRGKRQIAPTCFCRHTRRERVYVGKASPLGTILVTMLIGLFIGCDTDAAFGDVSLPVTFSRPVRDLPDRSRAGALLFSARPAIIFSDLISKLDVLRCPVTSVAAWLLWSRQERSRIIL